MLRQRITTKHAVSCLLTFLSNRYMKDYVSILFPGMRLNIQLFVQYNTEHDLFST